MRSYGASTLLWEIKRRKYPAVVLEGENRGYESPLVFGEKRYPNSKVRVLAGELWDRVLGTRGENWAGPGTPVYKMWPGPAWPMDGPCRAGCRRCTSCAGPALIVNKIWAYYNKSHVYGPTFQKKCKNGTMSYCTHVNLQSDQTKTTCSQPTKT